mmetsp:Transcript_35374/g.85329  ORF Transcript_35374/g.85329 Transcript_35374/m.85329 type:complete len:283 (-) Transcript_35374:271-1119(-)
MAREAEVAVDLHEVRLSPPQLRGVVPRRRGAQRVDLVQVQRPYLSGVAVPLVGGIRAERFDVVRIGLAVDAFEYVESVLVLSDELGRSRAGEVGVGAETIVHYYSHEQPVGACGTTERRHERLRQQMLPKRRDANVHRFVLPDIEYRSSHIRILERSQILPCDSKVRFTDRFGLLLPPSLASDFGGGRYRLCEQEVGFVEGVEVSVQYGGDAGYRRTVLVQRPMYECVGVRYGGEGGEVGQSRIQVRRLTVVVVGRRIGKLLWTSSSREEDAEAVGGGIIQT